LIAPTNLIAGRYSHSNSHIQWSPDCTPFQINSTQCQHLSKYGQYVS